MRRAATLGDGWIGNPDKIPEIRALLKGEGREQAPFQFTTISGAVTPEQIEDLADQGVDCLNLAPWAGGLASTETRGLIGVIERFAASIGLKPPMA